MVGLIIFYGYTILGKDKERKDMMESSIQKELTDLVKKIINIPDVKSENIIAVIKSLSELEYELQGKSNINDTILLQNTLKDLAEIITDSSNHLTKSVADVYDELRHYCYPEHLLLKEANINKYVSEECIADLKKVLCKLNIENVIKLDNMFKIVLQNCANKENEELKLKRIYKIAKIKENLEILHKELLKFKEETKASELASVYAILESSNIFNVDIDALRIVSLCYADYNRYQHILNHIN